ncbi:hypothetical protein HK102_002672 [Quaeritorhiza haematococci]|nr:hypothetical protein HK102_002672 [Quaeritorhiza haematococci]
MISKYFFKRPSEVPVSASATPPPSNTASPQDPKPISNDIGVPVTKPDGSLIELKDYLAQELTTDQQRLFMASTWMYLNQNGKCCIDLEDGMTWMGVTEKKHQKAKLERRFRAGIDYQVLLGTYTQQTGRGGHNKETIMITPETFKSLCMLADTQKGDEVRQYFSTMELIVQNYTLMQQTFKDQQYQLQLEEQTRVLQNELQAKESELQQLKSKKYEQREHTGFCYVIKTDGGIKVGKTKDVRKRVKGLQTANVGELKILLAFPTCEPDLVEKGVHLFLDRYRSNANREFFDCDPEYIKSVVELTGNFVNTMGSAYQAITRDELVSKLGETLCIEGIPPPPTPVLVSDPFFHMKGQSRCPRKTRNRGEQFEN